MSNKFEPYNLKPDKNNEFSTWEYQAAKEQEEVVVVDEKAEFLAECERLRQDAVKKGYEQGQQHALTELNEKRKELAAWLDLIQNPVKLLDEHLIQDVIQTITWLSQHCISVELSVNPEKLRDLLNEIKTELPSLTNHRHLAMNPLDVAWVQAEFGENEIPGLHQILVADPALNRGDFYLKGEHSELDGRMHTRFSTLFAKYLTKDNLIVPIQVQD
ncbi:MAG: flagellar assembly protein FliH [Legionella sp.]|nr:flagellar assembly protein FliH [Legionella sp.]